MDRGVCISWYDLPAAGREAYLSWLHGRYLPALLKKPGIAWAAHYAAQKGNPPERLGHTDDASVPAGGDYILIVGASDAHAFSPPHPYETFEPVTESDAAMRALRANERVAIMTEEARASGPESGQHPDGTGLAPCIQLGSFNALAGEEDELLAWYARWRMRKMETLPGCVRVRKLAGVSGWAKHAVLYEFTSVQARNAHFPTHEHAYPELEAWTDKVVRKLIHAPRSPQIAQRIWPA